MVFDVASSPAEEIHDETMEPQRLCEANAVLKAEAVAGDFPESVVIAADTLVFIDGRALGKPRDMNEARGMLRLLAGRMHRVCTGVCMIFPGGRQEIFHALTEVVFRELDDDAIDGYLSLVDPLDKAGAYGIQEHGELIVAEIRGSFENVMGLPVDLVVEALGRAIAPV